MSFRHLFANRRIGYFKQNIGMTILVETAPASKVLAAQIIAYDLLSLIGEVALEASGQACVASTIAIRFSVDFCERVSPSCRPINLDRVLWHAPTLAP
jgi:hypothetical protein